LAIAIVLGGCLDRAPARRDLANRSDVVFGYCDAPVSSQGREETRRARRALEALIREYRRSPDAAFRSDTDVSSEMTARGILNDLKSFSWARCPMVEHRLAGLDGLAPRTAR
jgi:hypothetical protein